MSDDFIGQLFIDIQVLLPY